MTWSGQQYLFGPEENPVACMQGASIAQGVRFLRGDCDGDGRLVASVNDAIANFRHCFTSVKSPCRAACDADGDGSPCTGVSDGLLILRYLFFGGNPLPAPFPACDVSDDPADVALGCRQSRCY